MDDPGWLRAQAVKCRTYARVTLNEATADLLREMAGDYELRADELERQSGQQG
jgi:hypothetical protein